MTETIAKLVRQLRARLPDCGSNLCTQYAEQVRATGMETTAEDAFNAWVKWIEHDGGEPAAPLRFTDPNGFHARAALVIREVARYGDCDERLDRIATYGA